MPKRGRPRAPVGTARARKPIKIPGTKRWRARYVDLRGRVRQCGVYSSKTQAKDAADAHVAELNRTRIDPEALLSLNEWLPLWETHFPRWQRTAETIQKRINDYVVPRLLLKGDELLDDIRVPVLINIQNALVDHGLAKSFIDKIFVDLSTVFADAMTYEVATKNPARGLKVRAHHPGLAQRKPKHRRALVTVPELHAVFAEVREEHRAASWAFPVTGGRPAEVFGYLAQDIDRERWTIRVHQTIDESGSQSEGTKTSHHKPYEWDQVTLFPQALAAAFEAVGLGIGGKLLPAPAGGYWAHSNWRNRVWAPAFKRSGVEPFAPYGMRHFFCSHLLGRGIPLVEIAAWMGHSLRAAKDEITQWQDPRLSAMVQGYVDNTTSQVYSHATGAWLERALSVMTEVLIRPSDGGREST